MNETAPLKTLVIICGALAKEVMSLTTAAPDLYSNLEIMGLPAILHNTPHHIVPRLDEKLQGLDLSLYKKILIGYGDCGTGGDLERLCQRYQSQGVDIDFIHSPHCYAFYSGTALFEEQAFENATLFYLTDFLAEHFENFVIKPLGLDRYPQLKEEYFQHYTGLRYLAQRLTPKSKEAAEKASEFLGLPLEIIETGYGELETSLKALSSY
jgi:hypothetical protein